MLASHLCDVRAQKLVAGVPTVRFCMPSPRTSPTKSPRMSRALEGESGREAEEGEQLAMQRVREMRRGVVFRPRFDPEGVRRLCSEALAELEG